ncbi:MAG: hypothetical protein QF368_19835, partial [SAR202 cluster bacterium]|nr:hypothetical protein [SAR202 cluster bacterium]
PYNRQYIEVSQVNANHQFGLSGKYGSIGADIFNETNQSGRNVSSKIASDQTLMLELDRWYAIRVEILGPNIVVNLDGETILSATAESPIEAKRVGLESRKGLSYYIDDVRVVELLLEADGLVAYWPADGNADDVVGGNHGTLRDGASFGDGVVGQAFSFDGVDDYVEIPATANLTQEGTTSLTVAAWIKIEEPCHGVINGRPHWVLHWQGCGRSLPVRLGFHIGAEGGWSQVDSDTAVDGEWHHWVGVYDGSSQKLYLDGALDISVVHTGPIIGTGDGNPDWLTIGKDYHPVSMGNSYAEEGRYNSGLIDEVRIYDRALTADEIKTLYDEVNPMMEASSATIPSSEGLIAYWPADGNANDVAGGNHGTLQAGASFADGIVGQAFSFDGIGEYVRVPDVPSLQLTADTPSTLSGWIFPVDMPPDRFVAVPIEKDYYFELLYQTGNNALRAHVHNGTHWIYIDTPYDLQLNRWTHLAQTWDGETLRVYADGVLLGAGATLGVSYQPVPDDASLDIGKHIETTFSGLIDEVRIYDRALSDEEIKAMYDSVSQ